MKKFGATIVAVFALSLAAFAWPSCSGNWNQVANGTTGTAGTGGIGETYNADGITWQCQPKTPPPTTPPSTPSSQTQNQTQNQNQQQNQNATATSGSNSTSGSTSTSGATATGGNSGSTSSATGGTSTATGGKVSNSGNSSNTNTNTAQGGKGGQGGQGGKGGSAAIAGSGNSSQTQSTTSQATGNGVGNGNNSNDYQSSTLVEAAKIPVSTAFAPSQFPTVGCYKTYSGGVQGAQLGISLGGGKIDENCAILEAAGRARNILAYCKVYITDKYVHKAGVTLEDCMHQEQVNIPLPPPIVQAPVPQPTVIVVPATPAPVPVAAAASPSLVGVCDRVNNECKQWLDDAINWKKQNDGRVVIYGSLTTYPVANAMRVYLKRGGLTDEDILVQMTDRNPVTAGVGFGYER
jgi:hypothetical protein